MTQVEQIQESQENIQTPGAGMAAGMAAFPRVIEPDQIVPGATESNRMISREDGQSQDSPLADELTVIVHEPVDGCTGKRLTRANPLVYEAKTILREFGWLPVRLIEPDLPINLIGMKGSSAMLILVLRSRNPVPSGAVLRELFPEIVRQVIALVPVVHYRIMIWVYSPRCGWRYYIVYQGGLRNDLEFPQSLQK